ncbi:MAG: thiamine pyrophosphate-dependent enzyme [Acidimicrobiia bacterium]
MRGSSAPTSETGKRTKSSPAGVVDHPFNPVSLALGAEATFVARTVDMDRDHTMEILRRAYQHQGSAFIEIYQNCNVFNDKAFIAVTGREERFHNRIDLEHGKPVVFGVDKEQGVTLEFGNADIVYVQDVGIKAIHVHDEKDPDPSAAFALSRLSHGPHGPTPLGTFRAVERPTYDKALQHQLLDAQAQKGPGDLYELITQTGTWTVE